MKITYKLNNDKYSYTQVNEDEEKKLNFILTNNKGDFLNLGIQTNSLKSQGLNFCDTNTLDIYKILENISVTDLDIIEIENQGHSILRKYASKVSQVVRVPLINPDNKKSEYDEDAKLEYNNNGILQETYEEENEIVAQDRFYLGPSGGMIYEIENYEGNILVDLDIRKLNDLDEWGRDYNVYNKNGTIIVEYTKTIDGNQDYKVFYGIKTVNFQYDFLKDWVKKEYEYSKRRNSLCERYIYRLMTVRIQDSKRLYMGFGLSEKDVLEQISLLEQHYEELEKFDDAIYNDLTKIKNFRKPIPQDFMVAYRLSNYAMYNFFNRNLDHEEIKVGCFAGFPWFAQVWTRDELVGIKGFINNDEDNIVKEKLFEHLNLIDENTGLIKRIKQKGALDSVDGLFWLAKRFEDFIFHLDTRKRLNNVIPQGELELVYNKLQNSFKKIIENYWDSENELLKVKYGDSWMDTIEVEFPMDIQVQFLEFVSFLNILNQILQKKKEDHLIEFETLLKNKIKEVYFRNGYLYNEKNYDKINSNVFLAYYFYPTLFSNKQWELIFDNTLLHLKTTWGGISSLSHKDSEFQESYTGENNLSYHKGDSWYWTNNIAAISMNSLNDQKYRRFISKILMSSTYDILRMGTIGYASEISSAKNQEAHGSLAQFWSVTTYLEMIDTLFEKKG